MSGKITMKFKDGTTGEVYDLVLLKTKIMPRW